ncbi:leucine-rich repeat-containing protein 34 isoform X1 [Motacilla alba alba]|uniref:leucine-rich repeat-containing protein 34 isoform X1 n=1 Tax=Motacilla alba alba TaxID=1094192 RepID=UPI0018D589D5|nr:leucine-rich repeat-containing protein 34 isoform X1 [Motacilla alba alba]XP_038001816.1 leucine-rich repeat-containing protein 34 isoform X1 [Motacilla alba alba]XP_038001817.1 leucine-rich repeat-containing protein 34 isoform X1 [Motacilla alba alba]
MSVLPDLHLHYVQACQNLSQPENPFIARVLQEADKNDEISTKGITLKLAGNNHLVPVPRVTDDDLGVLVSVLGQAAFVTGLDLAYNLLTDAGAKTMATFLQENSTLQYLNLMFNDIGTSGAELIAGALCSNQSLVHLRMTGNKIGNQGGMFFASMLKINSALKKLDLGDCDVGLKCLISTAIALTQNKSLKAINLNRPLLSSQQEETTVHIARMLRSNSSLVELHLGKHGMKNFGVERLCDALYENSSLRYLDLSCNNITCDGVKFLGELLKKNQTLEILDLEANRIEDVGAIYLSEALATRNRSLKALSVVSNNITGKGLVALAQAMHSNMTLSHIYIWGNKLDRSTCEAFSELLAVERLQLGCTDVAPYKVDGQVLLAELSHGLAKHRYWSPRCAAAAPGAANASLQILAVSEYL